MPPSVTTPTATRPLAGVRVLELARVLAGPWAGQLLADLGAEVVKVERPGRGDDTRHWGPPYIGDPADLASSYFASTNRGKRSVALDFGTPADLERIEALVAQADVLTENFKVGGLARYGLDYAGTKRLNPRLVYCSITGFGQDGPYSGRPGYDFLIQGMSGAMSLTGEPDGAPMKTGVAYADIFTGLYAATAILAALRARDATGAGCHIDMALLDTQIAVLGNQAMHHLVAGMPPPRVGNAHASIVPYQLFPTAEGDIIVACGNDAQFRNLCEVLGTRWHEDAAYATNPARVAHRGAVTALIAGRTATWATADLLASLERAGVPAGPINTLPQVFLDPQVVHRGMVVGGEDGAPVMRSPIVIDGAPQVSARPAPRLGADGALAPGARADDTWDIA